MPSRTNRLPKHLTIVTTTKNCVALVDEYLESVAMLDARLFDWIVVDAASTDGTRESLERCLNRFAWFTSEPDQGTYHGLNKAIAKVATAYYVVFGVDDKPSASFLIDLLPLLKDRPALVLGATELVPSGRVKLPGRRWMHHWSWGRVISHHSVGTVIRTDLHDRFGLYDTSYRIVADGAFLTSVLRSEDRITMTDRVFGAYAQTGISGREEFQSICESFRLQCAAGSSLLIQLPLLNYRLLKSMRTSRAQGTSP